MLGVIVFAHGSRDPLWRLPVESVAQQIGRCDPAARVLCAYLELCEPDMATAARQMVAQGVTRLRVLPLFFGMGKHAREDLPVLMTALAQAHPEVRFEQLPAAGEDPRLTAVLATIALEDLP
ncbi:MAG: CbiX/SirB N-terminal domain-containing protein [Hydrogenophaga sp.]|jgi:sirohydrochlorin cobaltochelatase|uniref:sirohydrochlorin chelatase n=1 Tax=Hydrogenophaga sp. TaxID=1904254 RepID=UPI002719CFBC|nr:CbiX/SirB N-terminal domain-containing protein [Hydrogenophaga sp.]MDO9605605.1 CbiX/SirB N-terminal domain-containing protein [Hydrogenophaga sp.]MDP2165825.1 CbiX/SirB N-terminal domain-containing protein [Hydrogenophaga sp.]MDP3476987.1 CbiX/SirB N-terminal domain-containing protein [Hydrogenophaga sp.]